MRVGFSFEDAIFFVPEQIDVEFAIFLPLAVFDLEVKLGQQFFPVSVGEIPSSHQVVAPLYVLPVVEFDKG